MGEKSGVVGKVVHYYWIIESAKKWIMECVNEQKSNPRKSLYLWAFPGIYFCLWSANGVKNYFFY